MVAPTGTVTLLFTDVEGSTKLWERFPTSMAAALARHDEIMRQSIEACGGFIFKTVGDEFCAAFVTSTSAVAAAVTAQLAIRDEPWPQDAEIAVRMALHSGTCQERDDDYFGPSVNRVARLLAVGHGGQVVVSGATAELLADLPSETAILRDLGPHRLKDLGRPEHVWQLEASGLRHSFAPLRSLDNPELPNNLPTLLSSFVGRERELEEVRSLVIESRLVTLTGAGGAGKTRLAMQTAAELLDGSGEGVWLVELAAVSNEEQVPFAISSILGVKETVEASPLETLIDALEEQSVLLILDNCEHVVGACAKFAELAIRHCPRVYMLATSREPLGVDGERVYRVPSLSLPREDDDTIKDIERYDAVSLFLNRARDAGYHVDDDDALTVGSICRRLDGIPLALELAAGRLSSMSPRQLSDRLDQRFRLLTGGSRHAMARQQTLQAMVDWSYGLLNPSEQSVLRHLSVFVGGFELEAAESVCTGENVDEFDVVNLLHSLVEKSLVVADQAGTSIRFRLLETIRQYGAQKLLESDDERGVLFARDRHADFYLALAREAEAGIVGPDQRAWFQRLNAEIENLRAVASHLSASPNRAGDLLALGAELEWYLFNSGRAEFVAPLRAALSLLDQSPSEELAVGQVCVAYLISFFLEADVRAMADAHSMMDRGLAIARSLDSRSVMARALTWRSFYARLQRAHAEAEAAAAEAIAVARSLGDANELGNVLFRVSFGNVWSEDADERHQERVHRRGLQEEALACFRRVDDVLGIAWIETFLGVLNAEEGDFAGARAMSEPALRVIEEMGAVEALQICQNNHLIVLVSDGDFDEAEVVLRRCLRYARRVGQQREVADLIFVAACCATERGQLERAARLWGANRMLAAAAHESGRLFESEEERRLFDVYLPKVRDHLAMETYEREFDAGSKYSGQQACEFALGREVV